MRARAQSGPSTRRLGARARARAPGPLVPERSRAAHPPRATSLPAHRTVNFTANTHTATTPEKPRTPLGHLPAAAAPLRNEYRRHLGLKTPHSLLHRVGSAIPHTQCTKQLDQQAPHRQLHRKPHTATTHSETTHPTRPPASCSRATAHLLHQFVEASASSGGEINRHRYTST